MQDTSPEMQKKQYEIFFKIPINERVKQGMEMIDFGMIIMENSIKNQHPYISPLELKIEKLRRLYKQDFSETTLNHIIQHFKDNFQDKKRGIGK